MVEVRLKGFVGVSGEIARPAGKVMEVLGGAKETA